ncbi:hypothetical protein ISF_04572 [Cordyceps fumosorosea ARSEF 2679]|uniref:Uncharacterized protein n=1 Tax=Cordyceps fumosorosea (strain ARSEF 2679) TaxID=1081104 RepID=A0A167WJC8_CORFA|nr:hypothetical protein ISF_04572 [Cordyceps fumosorosea ARSEF 2679]OAA63863.1 hypothetical protein ISF_04572 [Cordyceps fumosorosea ARSEF 2679]
MQLLQGSIATPATTNIKPRSRPADPDIGIDDLSKATGRVDIGVGTRVDDDAFRRGSDDEALDDVSAVEVADSGARAVKLEGRSTLVR